MEISVLREVPQLLTTVNAHTHHEALSKTKSPRYLRRRKVLDVTGLFLLTCSVAQAQAEAAEILMVLRSRVSDVVKRETGKACDRYVSGDAEPDKQAGQAGD